jgi:phosphoribosylaminoimidazolecarboxamide formyltransferase/IMP cyclohydrolase
MPTIQRALVSVSDKTGLVEFVKGLQEFGVEILSTGGTAKAIRDAGVPVRDVADYTGSPEMLDGRVKTLHPKVHGGILAIRDNPDHMEQVARHGIELIDMVVVNLYPFRQTIAKPGVTLEEAIENIDIGGPSMVRSAAKNHRDVAVVCNPARYPAILKEMRDRGGEISEATRRELALEAFTHTARYDAAISNYLAGIVTGEQEALPRFFAPTFEQVQGLRYGENPHQRAAFYRDVNAVEPGLPGAEQLHGKELSYNNILDLMAALELAREFDEPAAIIIKHNNPCGAATAPTLPAAFEEALICDPVSRFGSVIAFNRPVCLETAERMISDEYLQDLMPRYVRESGDTQSEPLPAFVEAVIAPAYDDEALVTLRTMKNLRILRLPDWKPASFDQALDFRRVPGGLLLQDRDSQIVPPEQFRVVTHKQPTADQLRSMLFADRVAKHVKSNAIILVKGTATVGIGAGQMSRVDSTIIAARKAGKRAQGSVLASDAMFPARDGIDACAKAGAVAIIQPGGSIRDDECIAAADEHGIAMVLTGMRHFRH